MGSQNPNHRYHRPDDVAYFHNVDALHESEYDRGTGCGKTARPGLCGGCRATGIPTADEENNIDLVLMDLQMPVMDGFDATAEIRRRELGCGDDAHVPIIALSAAVLDADRKKAAKAGVDDHLGKPIDPQELYAVMGQYLQSAGTISEEPASPEEEAAAAEEFPVLDGFDPARGKASAQGKRDTYMKLLRSFNTQITGAFADFPDRMSSLTFEEIQHEAHTIKGIAATVGALRVAEAAAVIDRTGTEQTVPTESMVNELHEALLCAKEQIAPHLSYNRK